MAYRSRPCCALPMMTSVWNAWRSDVRKRSLNQIELFACNAPKSCCKCSQMTLSGSPMRKFSRCLHRWIRKMTVCTFRQSSREAGRGWASVAYIYANSVQSVVIWKLGFTDLIFVDPGVKVNGSYYRDVLLSQKLLETRNPRCVKCRENSFFIFQQNSAPAHRARDTVRLLEQTTPAFITPDLWPSNSQT